MNVIVTGGSGRIGRDVVTELVGHGHAVLNADVSPPDRQDATFLIVDLTDAGQIYQAIASFEAEAVIHLGAWLNAAIVVDSRTYSDNVRMTFNVLQACADLGVRRAVVASSAQVYGFAQLPPVYLRADEDHPLRPLNCYALGKMAGEQAADYFAANHGLSVASFRFQGVRLPDELMSDMDRIAEHGDTTRAGGFQTTLWTRCDSRDAAAACRLAIEAPELPTGPYNITGPRVVFREKTADLAERYFGSATELRDDPSGHAAGVSCAKAEAAFGYRPQYAWSVDDRFPVAT